MGKEGELLFFEGKSSIIPSRIFIGKGEETCIKK